MELKLTHTPRSITLVILTFNRTIVELKCVWAVSSGTVRGAFNRTIVELKSWHPCEQKTTKHAFNRTIVELKSIKNPRTLKQATQLLIVP